MNRCVFFKKTAAVRAEAPEAPPWEMVEIKAGVKRVSPVHPRSIFPLSAAIKQMQKLKQ